MKCDAHKQLLKNRISNRLSDGLVHTAQDLAWSAMINESTDSYPATRGLIREMINEGSLIGSTVTGYKLMTDGKEVQQCLNSLLRRQMGITKRIQAIYDAATAEGVL